MTDIDVDLVNMFFPAHTKPGEEITIQDLDRLKGIFQRCIVQSKYHEQNIWKILAVLLSVIKEEFRKDNDPTLYDFALECFANAAALELPNAAIGHSGPLPKVGSKGIRKWAPMIAFEIDEEEGRDL